MRQTRFTENSSRYAFLGLMLCLILTAAWVAQIEGLEREWNQQRARLENLSVEQLLDRLVQEKAAEFNDANAHRFFPFFHRPEAYPWEDEDSPEIERIEYPKAKASPILAELVRRGAAVVPQLLEHLEDKRPTKWFIRTTEFGLCMTFGNGYDARNLDPRKQPSGTVAKRWATDLTFPDPDLEEDEIPDPPLTFYTFTVGDMCYMVIGNIVNRLNGVISYNALGSMLSISIQSPVRLPALAQACRDDWSGLTPEKHRQCLLQDGRQHELGPLLNAVDWLVFFYPKDGEELLVKLISRPIYDEDILLDFIETKLLFLSAEIQTRLNDYFNTCKFLERLIYDEIKKIKNSPNPCKKKLYDILSCIYFNASFFHEYYARDITKIKNPDYYKSLIMQFKSASKDNSWITLPYWLHNVCRRDLTHTEILLHGKAALANQICELAFPDYDPYNPYYLDAVSVNDQAAFLMLLRPYSTPRVDHAMHELFKKAILPNPLFADSPNWGERIAKQCIKHLAGKSYDPELRAYLQGRIQKLDEGPDSDEKKWDRKELENLLRGIGK